MIELIAEIGWNHLGDMSLAEDMIIAASEAGADYAKFQTWSVDYLKPGPWDKDGRREIYERAQLSHEDHFRLKEICDVNNIKFLTTCFNAKDIDFLRQLTPTIKIASFESSNVDLITRCSYKFDTIFLSTGCSDFKEYEMWGKNDNIFLLHCVSSYPCSADHVNLPKIEELKKITPRIGYSGHYLGILDAICAASLGCKIIEKHFTLDRSLEGKDNAISINPIEMKQLRQYINEIDNMLIDRGVCVQDVERQSRIESSGKWSYEK